MDRSKLKRYQVVGAEQFDRDVTDYLMKRLQDGVSAHGKVVVALPTGSTPLGIYRTLVKDYQKFPWEKVVALNLDEYVGIGQDHPDSFASILMRECIKPMGLKHFRLLNGLADPVKEAQAHEDFIKHHGGLDLALVGIGQKDSIHLALNERGSAFDSRTRLVAIDPNTQKVNKHNYREGITMGLATITEARQIILIAKGAAKKSSIEAALLGPVTPEVPASILQLHASKVSVFVDHEANPQ